MNIEYVVSEEAGKMLRGVTGPMAVVSVAGLYRTGKSYLLNRMLLNRGDGFGVGPTVNPCTKGLWIWGTPLKGISAEGESVNVLVIDTEGIGALDEDQTHDTKIFTLAVLASSVFIYNSVGSIDENAIQNLSLVVNLSKHIQLRSGEDDPDPDQMATCLPSFYWVVRDFSLQLVDTNGLPLTPKEYLQKALAPQHGFSDDVEEKNRIRRLLTSFFRDRECFTLIRPLVDETKLQHLQKLNHDQLRPQFVEQVIGFRRRVLNAVKVKTLQNKALSGDMYVSMLTSYVGAINEGAVPNIEHAWRYMCEEQTQKTMAHAYEHFMCEIKDRFNTRFPCSEEDFLAVVSSAEEAALHILREKAIGEAVNDAVRELKGRIAQRVEELKVQNEKEATQILKQFIKKSVAPLETKLRSREYKSYEEFETAVNNVYEHLINAGPKLVQSSMQYMLAAKKLQEQGAKFMFLSLKKEFERVSEVAQEKENYFTGQIEKLRTEKEADRQKFLETIGESDERLSELRCKVEGLQTQLASTSRLKEDEEKKLERTIASKQYEIDSLRKSMETRVEELVLRSEEVGRQLSSERKEWEQEKAIFELRSKQQQASLEELQRKEKTLDSTLHLSKNEMQNQLRELALKYERESEDLRRECLECRDKLQEVSEEAHCLKEELESKSEKHEKKEKKYREELQSKSREYERSRNEWEAERLGLVNQVQDLRDGTERETSEYLTRCTILEQALKNTADDIKKLKIKYEDEIAVQMQRQEFAAEEFERAKRGFITQRDLLMSQIASYEQKEGMEREEGENKRITELRNEHTLEVDTLLSNFENQKKRLLYEIDNLSKKATEATLAVSLLQSKLDQSTQEDERLRNTVREENDHLRLLLKNTDRDYTVEMQNKECDFVRRLRELENEMVEVKEKGMNELREAHRVSEESIMQLKNSYEINKMALEKKLATEKERSEKRLTATIEEYETRMRDATVGLEEENEELKANMNEQDEMMQREIHIRDHELDIARKKVEGLQKIMQEVKDTFNKREIEFTSKLEAVVGQARQEKDKHEAKLDALIGESNRKDKEIMALTHHKEQLTSTLDKKELRLSEIEAEVIAVKEQNALTVETLRLKNIQTERENYDKLMAAVKDNALLKQENDFKENKLREWSRVVQLERQTQEEKYGRMKEEKETELRTMSERLGQEKSKLELKHREYKNRAKEDETTSRRQINELAKEKAVLEERAFNAENKVREFEEKKAAEVSHFQAQIGRLKEAIDSTRKRNSEQISQLKIDLNHAENERTDFKTALDRERILAANKLKFIEQQKDAQKKELEEALRQKESKIELLNNSRLNDKSQTESYLQDNMKNMEIKWRSKVQELNEEITKRNYESEAFSKNHEIELKAAHEKYHYQKLSKEMIQNTSEKKINELSELIRKITEDIQRIKSEKEVKETEYQKKFKEDNEMAKNKYQIMEDKAKQAASQKQMQYFQHEKERVKWVMEKENLERKLEEAKDLSGKLERDLARMQKDNEKMKAQRKNGTKTHSYIKQLTTTFVERNHDEENKQNLLAQKQ